MSKSDPSVTDQTLLPMLRSSRRVLDRILGSISYEDRLRCRLVCTGLRNIVNSASTFAVRLDDRVPQTSHLTALQIHSCIVEHLRTSAWSLKNLQFPEKLQKLVLSGPVSVSNFIHLQSINLSNVRELELHTDVIRPEQNFNDNNLMRRPNMLGIGIFFPNLDQLTLGGPTGENVVKGGSLSRRIFRLFLLGKFQKMTAAKIYVECNDEDQSNHLALILGFMAKNFKRLRDLTVNMTEVPLLRPKHWSNCPVSIGYSYLLKVQQDRLKAVQLRKFIISPVATGIGSTNWANVLFGQTKLVVLECQFHLCPIDFYQDIITHNCSTLREVTLRNLSCWKSAGECVSGYIRFFSKCSALRSLTLVRCKHDKVSPTPEVPDLFLDPPTLPASLTQLSISGYTLWVEELEHLHRRLVNLESLRLLRCGSAGLLGVTPHCLQLILVKMARLRNLHLISLNTEESALSLAVLLKRWSDAGFLQLEHRKVATNPAKQELRITFSTMSERRVLEANTAESQSTMASTSGIRVGRTYDSAYAIQGTSSLSGYRSC